MSERNAKPHLCVVPADPVIDWMDYDARRDAQTLREMMDAMTDAERQAFRAKAETAGLLPVLRGVPPGPSVRA